MKRLRMTLIFAVISIMLFSAQSALAVPTITKILVDGTSSISPNDFETAKNAVSRAVAGFFKRSQWNTGQLADWLSVSLFGGDNDYDGTIFVNCSDLDRMNALGAWMLTKEHPHYSKAAIFTAIGKGFVEVTELRERLPQDNYYLKNIIVITGGQNGTGNSHVKDLVQRSFPNNDTMLMVIGVGNNFDPAQFKNVANTVSHIRNFDELLVALMTVLESVKI